MRKGIFPKNRVQIDSLSWTYTFRRTGQTQVYIHYRNSKTKQQPFHIATHLNSPSTPLKKPLPLAYGRHILFLSFTSQSRSGLLYRFSRRRGFFANRENHCQSMYVYPLACVCFSTPTCMWLQTKTYKTLVFCLLPSAFSSLYTMTDLWPSWLVGCWLFFILPTLSL